MDLNQDTASGHATARTRARHQADESKAGETRAVLAVRGLVERSYIVSGCCAVAAADAIEQELDTWPFVSNVTIDDRTGEVAVTMRTADADLDGIVEALESIGYPAVVRSPFH